MNEEERTMQVIKELEDILDKIDEKLLKNQSFLAEQKKIGNSLRWINTNLDREKFKNFIKEREDYLEYGDVIINLLDSDEFNPNKYN